MYSFGVASATDPLFMQVFESVFTGDAEFVSLPWYAICTYTHTRARRYAVDHDSGSSMAEGVRPVRGVVSIRYKALGNHDCRGNAQAQVEVR